MLMYRTGVQTNLAGQLFVREIEVPNLVRTLANEDVPTFLDLPFTEAVDFFKRKYPEESDNVDFILRAYIKSGEGNAKLLMQQLAERASDSLRATLEQGGTLEHFARDVREGSAGLGIEAPSHSYLETVFRTQVHSAYGAGRFEQINRPAVIAARPYVEYRTAGDSSVRASHQILDGLQYRTDDPTWHKIAPPNGYNCRCSVITLDSSDLDRARLQTSIPDGGAPDQGFEGPPKESI